MPDAPLIIGIKTINKRFVMIKYIFIGLAVVRFHSAKVKRMGNRKIPTVKGLELCLGSGSGKNPAHILPSPFRSRAREVSHAKTRFVPRSWNARKNPTDAMIVTIPVIIAPLLKIAGYLARSDPSKLATILKKL
jgi:hypothetical protein